MDKNPVSWVLVKTPPIDPIEVYGKRGESLLELIAGGVILTLLLGALMLLVLVIK